MLLKQLSLDDKRDFLRIAELLSLADKPVVQEGKFRIRLTYDGSFSSNQSIQRGERESAAMAELVSICERDVSAAGATIGRWDMESALLKRTSKLPLHAAEDPATRAAASLEVLRDLLNGKKSEMPAVPKVMLFELMLLALADGSISSIEWQLLNEFKHHHRLEDHIFDDLLERAESTYREAQKTIAIILE